jgi:hypoxanthine phosphoribosyltransferase
LSPSSPQSGPEPRRLGRVVVEEAAIRRRLEELALSIRRDLPDDEPLLVGVLDGAYVLVADLARALFRCGVRPRVHFVRTAHYGEGREPSGRVETVRDLEVDPRGRAVLLVDDVLDTGRSLAHLRERLSRRGPAWLKTCVLLDKPGRRAQDIEADWVGFRIADAWVVGYGLDDAGAWRELPFVAELPD